MKPLPNSRLLVILLLICINLLTGQHPAHASIDIEGQVFIVTKNAASLKLGLVPIWVVGDSELRSLTRESVDLADALSIKLFWENELKKVSGLEDKAAKELGDDAIQRVHGAAVEERRSIDGSISVVKERADRARILLQKIKDQEWGIDTAEILTKQKLNSEFSVKLLIALMMGKKPDTESDPDGRFKTISGNSGGWIVAYSQRTVAIGVGEKVERYYWIVNLAQSKSPLFLSNKDSNISEAEVKVREIASKAGNRIELFNKFRGRGEAVVVTRPNSLGITQKIFDEEKGKQEELKLKTDQIAATESKKRQTIAIEKGIRDKEGRLFVAVSGGAFNMGSAHGSSDEEPVRSVLVNPFFMGETEVTYREWQLVLSWAKMNGYSFSNEGKGRSDMHPVEDVNWYDVVKWCNAKSEKEGVVPCYKAKGTIYRQGRETGIECDWKCNGYRLPTEAEWEKAARGGLDSKKYPDGDSLNRDAANFGGSRTLEVATYPANGYGLKDMVGNVSEWCWDWYGPYKVGDGNPTGPDRGYYRVLRGGGWTSPADGCRVSSRIKASPDSISNRDGFRLVRSSSL